MSESKHDGLDVGAIQKAFERLYLTAWDSAAEKGDRSETYSARMRPFEGTARMPLYPIPRFLEEKKKDVFDGMAAIDRSLAFNERLGLMTDCEIREYMMRPRGGVGAASPPFARVPNHNNELLLLL